MHIIIGINRLSLEIIIDCQSSKKPSDTGDFELLPEDAFDDYLKPTQRPLPRFEPLQYEIPLAVVSKVNF